MARYSSNLAEKETKETFGEGKESLPTLKKRVSAMNLEDHARECLHCTIVRQKEFASALGVSEGQVSRWASGERIPRGRTVRIIQVWKGYRKRVLDLSERLEIWMENEVWAAYGPTR